MKKNPKTLKPQKSQQTSGCSFIFHTIRQQNATTKLPNVMILDSWLAQF
jgi:hypothetical protein